MPIDRDCDATPVLMGRASSFSPRRRSLLKLGASAGLACVFSGTARGEAASQRVVVLDWGAAETMIAMGCMPVGLAEVGDYNRVVDEGQRAGHGIADVGLRLAPNAEAMHALRPSLIVVNSAQTYMRDTLERFAPVQVFEIYGTSGEPLDMAEQATIKLGHAIGAEQAATALQASVAAGLQRSRQRLAEAAGRPLFVLQLQDQRHAAVFGKGSLIQGVLDRLGIRNAWQGGADFWGLSVVGLEAFATVTEAQMAYFALPQVDLQTILSGVFWKNLPPVRAQRAFALPPLWAYGGLPSAERIANLLATSLTQGRG